MNIQELAQRLHDEGCLPSSYAIGSARSASDAFCLRHKGQEWLVCRTERGRDSPPIFSSPSEARACEFFYLQLMAMRHEHCVGFFSSPDRAHALEQQLAALNIESSADQIPYGGATAPVFRVFVVGKAIFAARAVLGEQLPLREPMA